MQFDKREEAPITLKGKALWITRTAAFIAGLVVVQFATAQFGSTLVTGVLVNLILIVSVVVCGPSTGAAVGVFSPIFAKMIGIGPDWSIIPLIVLGNIGLILLWSHIGNWQKIPQYATWVLALIIAASLKFLIIYFSVVRLVIPVILGLIEKQAAFISAAVSLPNLFMAAAGGTLAFLILPALKKVFRWSFGAK